MTDTTAKTRTITLTGRAPVRISDADWPEIVHASEDWYDSPIEAQANRERHAWIRVRQHADGRAIVYGRYIYTSAWQHEEAMSESAGEIVSASGDIAGAIGAVVAALIDQGADEALTRRVGREAIADLPAEQI